MWNAIKALLILIVGCIIPGIILGLLFKFIYGYSFLITFTITTIIVFMVGRITDAYFIYRKVSVDKLTKAAQDLIKTQQDIDIQCCSCKKVNIVPIIVTKENAFKCTGCGQVNNILMDFTTVIRTEPLTQADYNRIATQLYLNGIEK